MSKINSLNEWRGSHGPFDHMDTAFCSGYDAALKDVLDLVGSLIGDTLRQQIWRLDDDDRPLGN